MIFRLKRPEPSEAAVLSAVLKALAYHPRVAWAHRMNSGAAWLPGGRGGKQLVRFGFPGCPDVLGQMKTGQALAVEVKRPSGKTTPEQEAFLACVRANGGVAFIARSGSDVFKHLGGADAS